MPLELRLAFAFCWCLLKEELCLAARQIILFFHSSNGRVSAFGAATTLHTHVESLLLHSLYVLCHTHKLTHFLYIDIMDSHLPLHMHRSHLHALLRNRQE